MSKVLVLYYSNGECDRWRARQTGAHVDVKRAPELAPEEVARKSH